jgi:hypothetical protein
MSTSSSFTCCAANPLWTQPGYRRCLHWVFKVASLEANLLFYKNNFGLNVFRHEEFTSGCEATCNGPYGGAWSKTMIGYGESEQKSFALELTYNYGINEYKLGNDFRYLGMHLSAYIGPAEAIKVETTTGYRYVLNPDGHMIRLIDHISIHECKQFPFVCISLNVSNILRASAFYHDILGATVEIKDAENLIISWDNGDCVCNANTCMHVDKDRNVFLELVQLHQGEVVDRGQAFGRLAIETEDDAPAYIHSRFTCMYIYMYICIYVCILYIKNETFIRTYININAQQLAVGS